MVPSTALSAATAVVSVLVLLEAVSMTTAGLVPHFFRHEDLQTALSCYQMGNELAAKGQYEQATRKFREGIHVGRPVVLELAENLDFIHMPDDSDDPALALELLTQSYVASSDAFLQLGDLDMARKDAWAACLVTNNQHRTGLECMLQVCTVASDRIGELSTLKLLLEHTKVERRRRQQQMEQDKDGIGSATSESATGTSSLLSSESLCSSSPMMTIDDDDMELIQLSRRIAEVQRYLDNQLAQRLGKKKKQKKNGKEKIFMQEDQDDYDDGDDEEESFVW